MKQTITGKYGEYYIPKNLLGSSTKTVKGRKKGIETYILYLAPAKIATGIDICPFRSKGCTASCLYSAGRGKFSNVQKARINKTKYYLSDPSKFKAQLSKEIEKAEKKHGKSFCVRLNGTSDLSWSGLIKKHPSVQFYDYTKNITRAIASQALKNYSVTYSLSEEKKSLVEAQMALRSGINVASVFRTIPDVFLGYPVFNGDETDLRFLDPPGVVVGLLAKGEAKNDLSGFVQN